MSHSPVKTHLFLFDIDGTLIASGGAGEYSLRLAVRDIFGIDNGLEGIEVAGRTDYLITQNVFKKFGVELTPERATEFLQCYLGHLAVELPKRDGRVLPGVIALLDALQARPNVVLALLTGNLATGAEIKLTHYGLWDYFGFGAYADDHHDRNCLGPVALNRALETHGIDFPVERTFVIGDTPHDVTCGQVINAKTVAVATGRHTTEDLAGSNPDFLFDDLGDVDGVLKALGV